jgi:hypothetical protein
MNNAPTALAMRLQALATAETGALRAEWLQLYRTPPPPRLSRDLLARGIADKLQEAALGGLPATLRRRLVASAASRHDDAAASHTTPPARLRPGTRLLRSWHGRTYSVTVLDDGFAFEGRRYASLTEVAGAITGTHWSGPRFFGLAKVAYGGDGARADASTTPIAGTVDCEAIADGG